jgi:hypothetical protein
MAGGCTETREPIIGRRLIIGDRFCLLGRREWKEEKKKAGTENNGWQMIGTRKCFLKSSKS